MTNFGDRLANAVHEKRTPVLVGLDPRWESLPASLRTSQVNWQAKAAAFRQFSCEVIDAVASLVPAVKPQAAFFEELGPHGMAALHEVVQHARKAGLIVIMDGKRNDIGTTAAAYAAAYLGEDSPWHCDALTVSPYLGADSLEPFVSRAKATGTGVFVLAKTSNPGGGLFQDLQTFSTSESPTQACTLYRRVAAAIETDAAQTAGTSGYGAIGAVSGATYPAQLAELRAAMPHTWLLVPGYGAQGGAAADVAPGFDPSGLGAIVNNSRGIIFAHARPEFAHFGESRWQEAVAAATMQMIEQLRAGTSAGKL